MSAIAPLRFFLVTPLHSPLLLLALAGVGIVTSAALFLDPAVSVKAAVPVVFVQMVAASTGFAVRARRGHLDLLLTGGTSRFRVAVAHLAVSTAPGLAIWLAVGIVEVAATWGSSSATLSAGSGVAIAIVSALSWAITVPYPRLSGGIAWMLAMVTLVAMSPYGGDVVAGVNDAPTAARGLLYLLCPFLLIGRSLSVADVPAVVPALAVAACAVAIALTWMTQVDVPLEASQ
jgi:hypothetical protein